MEVIRIANDMLQSCTYLFDKYLVDCGSYIDVIKALGCKELKGVFLTHCHIDHIYGIEKILARYPCAQVYCSQKTYEGLKDENRNLSYIISKDSFCFTHDANVVVLHEGIHVIDHIKVHVLATPGHAEDCLSYLIEDCLFTGDSYIPLNKVFTKWPTSNKFLAKMNEARLSQIANVNSLKVFPGHWAK